MRISILILVFKGLNHSHNDIAPLRLPTLFSHECPLYWLFIAFSYSHDKWEGVRTCGSTFL